MGASSTDGPGPAVASGDAAAAHGVPCGIAFVDKEAGLTSHDVVARLRRRLGERRIGHAGTLDPGATGLLVVGVGHATRMLTFLVGVDKCYEAEVVLGSATTTLDAAGEVTRRDDMSQVSPETVARVARERLTGAIDQVPPMVSALRHDGTRLHELARAGVTVERPARRVTVHELTIAPVATDEPGVYAMRVRCSSGTYVRSLADDLGRLLGGSAHLRALRRTAVGPIAVDEAAPWQTTTVRETAEVLSRLPGVVVRRVEGRDERAVRNGRPWPAPDAPGTPLRGPSDATRAVIVGETHALLAMYERSGDGGWRPTAVMPSG